MDLRRNLEQQPYAFVPDWVARGWRVSLPHARRRDGRRFASEPSPQDLLKWKRGSAARASERPEVSGRGHTDHWLLEETEQLRWLGQARLSRETGLCLSVRGGLPVCSPLASEPKPVESSLENGL
jgi:hypothetical protein